MPVDSQEALNRSVIYELVSSAFLYPAPGTLEVLIDKASQVQLAASEMGSPELAEAVSELAASLAEIDEAVLVHEYVTVFGHSMSSECSLYEEEYANSEIFQKSGSLADLKGFYAAFGVKPGPELKDRLDHIGVELEFMHVLCLKEAYALAKGHPEEQLAVCREAQAKFLGEHLGQWAFGFVQKLETGTGSTLYGLIGQLLMAFLTFEMRTFGLEPGEVGDPVIVEPSEEGMPDCEACPLVVPAAERG